MKTLADFLSEYKRVQAQGYNWQVMDDTLFELCRRYPGHIEPREIVAKVGLVNRAYRANLQMGTEDAEWKLAQHLKNSDIDEHLNKLRSLPSFNDATAPVVLQAHHRLVEVCKEVTGRWALSFASKYLSFHAPRVVPIFDSYSYAEGWKYARGSVASPLPGAAAEDYRWHTASVLFLANHLRTQGIEPDVKLIDVVLYGQAGGEG
jgi:hypothetical protein